MRLSRHLTGVARKKKQKKRKKERKKTGRERDVKRQIASRIKKTKGGVSSSLICVGVGLKSWQRYRRGSISISNNTDHLSSYAKIKLDKQPP